MCVARAEYELGCMEAAATGGAAGEVLRLSTFSSFARRQKALTSYPSKAAGAAGAQQQSSSSSSSSSSSIKGGAYIPPDYAPIGSVPLPFLGKSSGAAALLLGLLVGLFLLKKPRSAIRLKRLETQLSATSRGAAASAASAAAIAAGAAWDWQPPPPPAEEERSMEIEDFFILTHDSLSASQQTLLTHPNP